MGISNPVSDSDFNRPFLILTSQALRKRVCNWHNTQNKYPSSEQTDRHPVCSQKEAYPDTHTQIRLAGGLLFPKALCTDCLPQWASSGIPRAGIQRKIPNTQASVLQASWRFAYPGCAELSSNERNNSGHTSLLLSGHCASQTIAKG